MWVIGINRKSSLEKIFTAVLPHLTAKQYQARVALHLLAARKRATKGLSRDVAAFAEAIRFANNNMPQPEDDIVVETGRVASADEGTVHIKGFKIV